MSFGKEDGEQFDQVEVALVPIVEHHVLNCMQTWRPTRRWVRGEVGLPLTLPDPWVRGACYGGDGGTRLHNRSPGG
jgi:hypothetical protein